MSTMEQRTMKSGWELTTLGKVCTVDWGNTELTKSAYVNGGKFLAVSAAGCDGRIEHKEHEKYTPVLSAIGAQCGRMFFPEEDFTAIKNTITLTPNFGRCTGRFLYQLLTHVDLPKRGTAQPFISKGDIQSFQIPLPPLAEQQRIVAILDEAFEGIATARKHAEQNLQNAKALFESHLEAVFSQKSEGWVETKLGEVCNFENGDRGKNYPNRNEYVETGIPWINTGHIQPDGSLSLEAMNFISQEKFDSLRSGKIQPGDLVYCLRGATLGKTALVDPLTEGAIASSLVILRPSALLYGSFLYFVLISPAGQGLIKGFENGAAQPNLGAKSVAKYPISFPNLSEQRTITESLILLRDETNRLCDIYTQKIAALDALKKSLLHQAFSGEL